MSIVLILFPLIDSLKSAIKPLNAPGLIISIRLLLRFSEINDVNSCSALLGIYNKNINKHNQLSNDQITNFS